MALKNLGDIRNDFLVKMNQSTTTGFYSDAMITTWISNANSWAASAFKWPFTEGRYSTTSASATTNEDGYTALNYPEGFHSDSIRLLTVGGKHFLKKNFYKFQEFVEQNPSDTSQIFSDYGRVIYINPQATGFSGTVTLWGQYNIPDLAADAGIGDPTASTIFTGTEEQGNEAILEKVISYALAREKSPTSFYRGRYISASSFHAQIAQEILDRVWKGITDEQFGYQDTLNEGMFKRFDVQRGGFKEDIFRRDQWGI